MFRSSITKWRTGVRANVQNNNIVLGPQIRFNQQVNNQVLLLYIEEYLVISHDPDPIKIMAFNLCWSVHKI
jgi:hypothetical protein